VQYRFRKCRGYMTNKKVVWNFMVEKAPDREAFGRDWQAWSSI